MLSALKRIVNNDNKNNSNNSVSSINNQNASEQHQSISQTLQKKFSKGVNYNSKINRVKLI